MARVHTQGTDVRAGDHIEAHGIAHALNQGTGHLVSASAVKSTLDHS